MSDPLLSMFIWQNLLIQFFITLVAFSFCKGEPWSFRYVFFATAYLIHGAFAIESLDTPILFANIQAAAGTIPSGGLEAIRVKVDFWKLIIPVASIGIGCSMIANFLSSQKPRS